MSDLDKTTMAQWVWATAHPYLFTFIEVSTTAVLYGYIAGKIITTIGSIIKIIITTKKGRKFI